VLQTLTEERQWIHQRACDELEESTRPTEVLSGQLVISPTPSFYLLKGFSVAVADIFADPLKE
jgi:hypothetical protein